jgi:hypothetical protein
VEPIVYLHGMLIGGGGVAQHPGVITPAGPVSVGDGSGWPIQAAGRLAGVILLTSQRYRLWRRGRA